MDLSSLIPTGIVVSAAAGAFVWALKAVPKMVLKDKYIDKWAAALGKALGNAGSSKIMGADRAEIEATVLPKLVRFIVMVIKTMRADDKDAKVFLQKAFEEAMKQV